MFNSLAKSRAPQLQSGLCGQLSIVTPAIGDDLLVLRSVEFARTCAPNTWYVTLGEGISASRIQQNEIEWSVSLGGLEHIVALLLRSSFSRK
jgi:hypothetical protein